MFVRRKENYFAQEQKQQQSKEVNSYNKKKNMNYIKQQLT